MKNAVEIYEKAKNYKISFDNIPRIVGQKYFPSNTSITCDDHVEYLEKMVERIDCTLDFFNLNPEELKASFPIKIYNKRYRDKFDSYLRKFFGALSKQEISEMAKKVSSLGEGFDLCLDLYSRKEERNYRDFISELVHAERKGKKEVEKLLSNLPPDLRELYYKRYYVHCYKGTPYSEFRGKLMGKLGEMKKRKENVDIDSILSHSYDHLPFFELYKKDVKVEEFINNPDVEVLLDLYLFEKERSVDSTSGNPIIQTAVTPLSRIKNMEGELFFEIYLKPTYPEDLQLQIEASYYLLFEPDKLMKKLSEIDELIDNFVNMEEKTSFNEIIERSGIRYEIQKGRKYTIYLK